MSNENNKDLEYSINEEGQQYIDHFRYLQCDQEDMGEIDNLDDSNVVGYQLREVFDDLPSLDLDDNLQKSKLSEELLERIRAKAEKMANYPDEDFEKIVNPQDVNLQNFNERNNQTHDMMRER